MLLLICLRCKMNILPIEYHSVKGTHLLFREVKELLELRSFLAGKVGVTPPEFD